MPLNKRYKDQLQTTDSIAPTIEKNSLSLDSETKSGFYTLHQAARFLTRSEVPNIVEDARVLEVLGDGQKVKYRILTQIPEIKLDENEQIDGYLEDFLIKARSRNDIGTKIDPESILKKEYKENMTDKEKSILRRKYLSAVATHDTFAPLYPSTIFSSTPNVNDVVRIYYYNSLIDSGEEIKGFYEIINQSSYFQKGENFISDLLSDFRKKFSEIFESLENFGFTTTSDAKTPEVKEVEIADLSVLSAKSTGTVTERFKRYAAVPNIVAEGVDYSFARPLAKELVKQGNSFVMRYIPYGSTKKELSKKELKDLLDAGLSVGFIFQRFGSEFQAEQKYIGGLGVKSGDSFGAGVAIAKMAKKGLEELGVKENVAVYFAIEADKGTRHIRPDEISKVVDFFKGCVSVMGLNRVGMYGGGPSMRAVIAANAAKYYWQSGAWSDVDSNGKRIILSTTCLLQNGISKDRSVDYNYAFSQDCGFLRPAEESQMSLVQQQTEVLPHQKASTNEDGQSLEDIER